MASIGYAFVGVQLHCVGKTHLQILISIANQREMKVRNKGKVHPSPSSSSAPDVEDFSVLNLLQAAILGLVSILSLQDREVLAYMITRPMKSIDPATVSDKKKKTYKKSVRDPQALRVRLQVFQLLHELLVLVGLYAQPRIYQAIEAFEDHLSSDKQPSKKVRGKKRDISGCSDSVRFADTTSPDGKPGAVAVSQPKNNVIEVALMKEDARETSKDAAEEAATVKEEAAVGGGAAVSGYKGLARKVLPDVLGLFNSRLWRLWSLNA